MDAKTESFKRLLVELNDGTKDVFLQPTTAATTKWVTLYQMSIRKVKGVSNKF